MKKLMFLIVGVLCTLAASAQTKVTWSMEVGVGLSSWMGDGADHTSPIFSPKVGVGIDVPLNGIVSFQTGLSWVSKGAKTTVDSYDVQVNQNYFQMPLLAAFHVGTVSNFDMVFTVGPYLAYGVNGKREIEQGDMTVSCSTFGDSRIEIVEGQGVTTIEGLKRLDAGIQMGVGLDFSKWTVGVDGDLSFVKIGSGNRPYNLAFYLTCAYKF